MSPNNYLKDSPVDGIVVTFTVQYKWDGIFKIVGAFLAYAGSDDYLRIFARSYLSAMGTGGTTPSREHPRQTLSDACVWLFS